ncbi:MAG: BREX-1 system phosphatase PglZ type B [Candidatus Cloacimonetes bacterium]|nr:BREX-1 system phosphatase PglZ type B [Candidatus Cloacimonadota bacterium]
MSKVINHLTKSLQALANKVLLWPDPERQWEKAIPLLRQYLPGLLCLGSYNPRDKTGPAIWLRCVIAGHELVPGEATILYLPGYSRQDLRAVESCPPELKPLVPLQFSGNIWSQYNGRDWTLFAYLISERGGLNLELAGDAETKEALQHALLPLLNEHLSELQGKRLDKDFFHNLITGGDPCRDLLNWLDGDETYRQSLSPVEWQAFCSNTKSRYGIAPEKDGILAALKALAEPDTASPVAAAWQNVWERYCEAPAKYPRLPQRLRQLPVPEDWMYRNNDSGAYDRYPQWNSEQEEILQNSLKNMLNLPATELRTKLEDLELKHGGRRTLIWAELGEAKYAMLIYDLLKVSRLSAQSLASGSLPDIAKRYSEGAWQLDLAVLKLLAALDTVEELQLFAGLLNTLYTPWAGEAARHLQSPAIWQPQNIIPPRLEAEAVLFVDGLRFDLAKLLATKLQESDFAVSESCRWTGLPTITATCKPILVKYLAQDTDYHLDAANYSALSAADFRRILKQNNWLCHSAQDALPLPNRQDGISEHKLWLEYGNLDALGHTQGWRLAKNLKSTLDELLILIQSIFAAGWQSLQILSDHGWLLNPAALPKTELSPQLSENKWRRFATLKAGVHTLEHIQGWYWDEFLQIAFAQGISCYQKGVEYTHGGISLQECLLLDLRISSAHTELPLSVTIKEIKWRGLRCHITLSGAAAGMLCDLRRFAAEAGSSLAFEIKPLKDHHTASIVVEDDSLWGIKAYIVILDNSHKIIAQMQTTIGGGSDD